MRLVFICCLAFTVVACGESNKDKSMSTQPASAVSSASAITAHEILLAFQKDIAICKSAMKLIGMDRAFMKEFLSTQNRKPITLVNFLRQSSVANKEEIQFILANPKFFEIEINFHPYEFAVAWVDGEAIFCAPTNQRLQDIEALGESQEAWEVRENFLDRWLAHLKSPSDEADYSPNQFSQFKQFVIQASRLYSSSQRQRFYAWVNNAIEHVELQRSTLEEGAGGQTLAEQNKIVDGEVFFLKSLLEQSPSPAVSSPVAFKQ